MTAKLDSLRTPAILFAALALLGLGALNLAFHDLLLQWQPAKPDAPWRGGAALVSGVLLVASGLLILVPRTRRYGAILGTAAIGTWTFLLHGPVVARNLANVAAWLGFAEAGAMALGLGFALSPRPAIAVPMRIALGACFVVFGLSHFVYAEITASMVPGWLPARLGIAYLTGAIHAGTGACLILGLFPRQAAAVEAAMMSSFVLLLHVPRVIAAPSDRAELTMLGIATLLSAAAWVAAASPVLASVREPRPAP